MRNNKRCWDVYIGTKRGEVDDGHVIYFNVSKLAECGW